MKFNKNNTNDFGIKKKIIIAIFSIVAVIIVLCLLILVLEFVLNMIQNKEKDQEYEFNFYKADYTENIFEDEEYMSLIENGYISYCNMDNITLGIDKDDAPSYGKDVAFLVEYIEYMIQGDVEAYNSCYSELYYSEEDPKDSFTMQKIYDVYIKKISEQSLTDDDGTYIKYVFSLNYKILKNNGTLRNDFLNGSKTQYIYISDRSGELKIDGITVINVTK